MKDKFDFSDKTLENMKELVKNKEVPPLNNEQKLALMKTLQTIMDSEEIDENQDFVGPVREFINTGDTNSSSIIKIQQYFRDHDDKREAAKNQAEVADLPDNIDVDA